MAVNGVINRSAAGALIPVEQSREIIKEVAEGSSFLRLARRLPNMTSKQRKDFNPLAGIRAFRGRPLAAW